MKKRIKQRQIARLNRMSKHGLTYDEILELVLSMSEDDLNKLMKRLKKQGVLG